MGLWRIRAPAYRPAVLTPDLRQLRYVVEVARQRSFTKAAARLHIAQQALSQQVRVVEDGLGVVLFERTNRGAEPTVAGLIFVQEAKRAIAAAERVVSRTRAAARGEAGTVRVGYTVTSAYETAPALVERLAQRLPSLGVELREVFAADVEELICEGRFDVCCWPHHDGASAELDSQPLRREPFLVAVAADHPLLAGRRELRIADLRDELLEVWPGEMSPGYFDAVMAAYRDAAIEPRIDERAGGSTVWGNIAAGRGVGLVVGSLVHQLSPGLVLVPLAEPSPEVVIDLAWHRDAQTPAIERVREVARDLSAERGWLTVGSAEAPR
jgi:LysR family transcriptional regulator, benzoate and cis,cis-muconate-responsive activator of ben and cat genes